MEKKIKYPDDDYLLSDMFSLTVYDNNGTPTAPSDEGDSGAVIVDEDGYPLGVIIAGDNKFSYAVKFSNFLSENTPYNEYTIIIKA